MKSSSSKSFLAALALVTLAAFTLAPSAEAARAGGGGGGGGGGGNRAAAGGGGGGGAGANRANTAAKPQASNANADARTNNVRNTSANNVNVNNRNVNNVNNTNNNVNVNRNVNVDVDSNNGCCNNGWDNDYHPIATAAAVTATVAVIGSMVRTVPPSCVPVSYGGMVYQQCGSTWYQPQGSQFVVVNPPY